MKTLFHSLLTLAFILSTFAVKANRAPQLDEVGPKITICFELGRKSRDCTRLGICDVTFNVRLQNEAGSNSENKATGTAWIENGKLKIEFDRGSMTAATYQTHFGSGNFQLEEDYVLPSDVASALGVRSYTIRTGKYAAAQPESESNIVPITF